MLPSETDPKKPGFSAQKFFSPLRQDAEYGISLSKYVSKVQYYFDNHLLEPNNAILDEAHKTYVLDKIVGLTDDNNANAPCLLRCLMQKPCTSVTEWQAIDQFFSSFQDLVILWIPLHRSTLLYAFFNEMLYRRYAYYARCGQAVIDHVSKTHGAKLDRSTTDKNVPGELLLVHHIVQFRSKGGFDVVMRTVSDPKPIGIRFFRNIIRFLWMIKPFYDDQIKKEILPRVPEAAFRSQLLNFDAKNLREISQADMDTIFEQMRLILKDTCDVEQVLLHHGFSFAIKCLEADILTKRVLGLEWVVKQLQVTYVSNPEMREALKKQLLDSSFFEKLFVNPVMKKHLVEGVLPILVWLLQERAVNEAIVGLIFRCVFDNQLTDTDVSDACFDLLVGLVGSPHATPDLIGLIWKQLGAVQPQLWSARAVRLVSSVARSGQSLAALEAVNWLWSAIDAPPGSTKLSSDCRVEAVSQLAHIPGAVGQKFQYLRDRFAAEGRLVHFRLLIKHIIAERKPQAQELFVETLPAFLSSFARYRAVFLKSPDAAKDSVVDVYKHLDEIKLRLDLASDLLRECNVRVSRPQFKEIWDAVMNLGPNAVAGYVVSVEERDLCLDGLNKVASDAHLVGEDGTFPLEWLLDLISSHPEFAAQSGANFRTFCDIFEQVNGTHNAFDFTSNGKGGAQGGGGGGGSSALGGGLRPVLKSLSVIGLSTLWDVVALASSSFSKDACSYILNLYLAPGPQLDHETETLRRRFCSEVLSRLGAPSCSADTAVRLLGLIKSGIESTTRAEDLAKKRDAAATATAAAPTEKALKDPPVPPYADMKDCIQRALDTGMVPEYIPEDLRYVVVALLFERSHWMRFDYWAGDMYESQDLIFNMIEKARDYKRVLPAGSETNKAASNSSAASCAAILAAGESKSWDVLFGLLERFSSVPSVSQLGWEVMSLFDSDQVLHDKVAAAVEGLGGVARTVDWNSLLGSAPNYKLLHSLQLLERSFIPSRSEESKEEHARKATWCKKFLRVGGFRYLLGLLNSLSSQPDIHGASCSTQCLVRILEVVYRFMRAPLSAADFAPELDARSPLELSVSSENLMFAGPTVLDIPDVLFSLVRAHAVSEHSVPSGGDEEEQRQVGAVGNYAIYLLIATILKVPSVWPQFRDTLSVNKIFEVLTGKNAQFSAVVAERLTHLSQHFVSDGQSESPQSFLVNVLLDHYPRLLSSHRHDCRSVFTLLCNLLKPNVVKPEHLKGLFSTIVSLTPKDDAAEVDEYLAGLMSLCAEMMRVLSVKYTVAGAEEEKLFSFLLDKFLYAPLAADGTPTSLARSSHLRQACFQLVGALVSTGALGADGLDRGLNALGGQYMEGPPVQEWKELTVIEADDSDRGVKSSKFMGLRNMACTCYLNATVQQLFNVQPFVSGILNAPTPKKDVGKETNEAAARDVKLVGLTALANVLRRVVADPLDEMIRLLHSESDEFKALTKVEHQGQNAIDFLKSIGWKDDGSGSLVLGSAVVLDEWQVRLRELNDACSALKQEVARVTEQVDPVEMFVQFQRMFAHLSKGGSRFYDPKQFVANFPDIDGKPVDVRRQEDAFEFFNRLQYLLEEQLKGSQQAKLFEDLFGVREVQVVWYDTQSKPSSPQPAPVLPLEFAPNMVKALDKVYDREGEWISGRDDNGKVVRVRKTMAIKSTSDYLIVYLKRYDVNMQKIKDTFEIHEQLDLSKWSDFSINGPSGQDGALKPEEWQYQLIGTLNHDGVSMNAGHYFSIIQKDDGSWWRFNDTNVTPFRKALTEENIGGECVMLFYRRKTLLYKPPEAEASARNQQLESDVLAENLRMYKLKLLTEKSLFDVLQRLLAARASSLNGLSDERRLWLAQLAVRFVFETLSRFPALASSHVMLDSWSQTVLRPLFSGFLPGAQWLLRSLLSKERSSWWLEFLLRRDEAPLRKVFADLVWSAVLVVHEDELKTGRFPKPVVGRLAPVYIPPAALELQEGLPLSVHVMDCLVSMSELSRAYWRNHVEFWDLIAKWAELGPLPRRHLAVTHFPVYRPIKEGDKYTCLDFPGLVLDYFLGQFTVIGKNVSRFSIGDRQSGMSLARQFDAWAAVMLSLANPSKKRSPEALDVTEDNLSVIDGQPPLAASQMVHDLLMTKLVSAFLPEWIKLGYNSVANNLIMRHWSWESQETSRIFLKCAVQALSASKIQMLRYPVSMMAEALLIRDNPTLIAWRASRVFEGTSETASVFQVFKHEWATGYSEEAAEKAIAVLAPLAKALPEGRQILSNNALELVKEYLLRDHKDSGLVPDAQMIVERLRSAK